MSQFGAQIRAVVEQTLRNLGVTEGLVVIEDKGALDCAIRARVQAAVLRAAAGRGGEPSRELDWSALS